MDANTATRKRILQNVEEAKSPKRILLPSLLKSRNKLRLKYRELQSDCKRLRNQAAAVERSRSKWRERTQSSEALAREVRATQEVTTTELQALRERAEQQAAELTELRAQLAAGEAAEKKGP